MTDKEIQELVVFLRDWQDCYEIDMLDIPTLMDTFKKSADTIEFLLEKVEK